MVSKQCMSCGRYFQGELNGDYTCPSCCGAGATGLRPLARLDNLLDDFSGGEFTAGGQGYPGGPGSAPRRPQSPSGLRSKSQAA